MQVFMHTNRFNNDPSYANQVTVETEPTAASLALIGTAIRAAAAMWRASSRYGKANVVLLDLHEPGAADRQSLRLARSGEVEGPHGRSTRLTRASTATPNVAARWRPRRPRARGAATSRPA